MLGLAWMELPARPWLWFHGPVLGRFFHCVAPHVRCWVRPIHCIHSIELRVILRRLIRTYIMRPSHIFLMLIIWWCQRSITHTYTLGAPPSSTKLICWFWCFFFLHTPVSLSVFMSLYVMFLVYCSCLYVSRPTHFPFSFDAYSLLLLPLILDQICSLMLEVFSFLQKLQVMITTLCYGIPKNG